MNLFFKEELLIRTKRQQPPYLADIDNDNTNDPFKKIKESGGSGGNNVLAIVGAVVGVLLGLVLIYVVIRKILNKRQEKTGAFSQAHGMPKTKLTKEEVGKTMNMIMGATQATSPPCGHRLPQKNCSRIGGDPGNPGYGRDSGREDSGVENDVFVPDNHEDFQYNNNNNNQHHHRNAKSQREMSASRKDIAMLEKVKNEKFCIENDDGRSRRQRKGNNKREVKEFFTPYQHKQHNLPLYDAVAEEQKQAKSRRKGGSYKEKTQNKRYSQRIARAKNEFSNDNKKRRRTIAEDGMGSGRTTSVLKNSLPAPNGVARNGRYRAEMEKFAMTARKERSKRASQAREDQVNAISKQRDFVPSSR